MITNSEQLFYNTMKINRLTSKAIAISLVTCSLILTSPRDASAVQLPVPTELTGLIAQWWLWHSLRNFESS